MTQVKTFTDLTTEFDGGKFMEDFGVDSFDFVVDPAQQKLYYPDSLPFPEVIVIRPPDGPTSITLKDGATPITGVLEITADNVDSKVVTIDAGAGKASEALTIDFPMLFPISAPPTALDGGGTAQFTLGPTTLRCVQPCEVTVKLAEEVAAVLQVKFV
jgi:hypothetical protein